MGRMNTDGAYNSLAKMKRQARTFGVSFPDDESKKRTRANGISCEQVPFTPYPGMNIMKEKGSALD
jgi:hypothetical protein